ncbi:ATP-dependent endonuclease [Pseudodesulfovibrio sp. S3]|nr:ATP-dependent endonuclease [Pseudodesulfovibrio sp. S3-i]RWU07028.1 ATP-dependent endonuclease [Pseudodesulfovibrio sp. S3]
MLIKSFQLKNFRRLKDVHVELDPKTSIFVGANNSGKTSATQAFKLFLGQSKERFNLYDFHVECWKTFDIIGVNWGDKGEELEMPKISLDLWFEVESQDIHRVIDLLPSLDWKDAPIGVRIEYAPKDPAGLIDRFNEAITKAQEGIKEDSKYRPWPQTLTDFLKKQLDSEYALFYYVLDHEQFDEKFSPIAGYQPAPLGGTGTKSGSKVVGSLLRVDFLNAQRHLTDEHSSGGRAENLSTRFSRFYERNLEKHEDDHEAMKALVDSEERLNSHLKSVFKPMMDSLAKLKYPGFDDPQLEIKSALNPKSLLNQGAQVHYTINNPNFPSGFEQNFSLPDHYNGLGYKNLIYMAVELLDFHEHWIASEVRPPLHLVFVEEPEAHLHVQLQQVFIRQVQNILRQPGQDDFGYESQLVVTTHSPHIIYESGFTPIRYFRRSICPAIEQKSTVLNLSLFKIHDVEIEGYDDIDTARHEALEFLQRYMKLTHCDLFFADGAILVEGNVERLLLPIMIEKSAKELRSAYLSILEVGGAYAHRFKELIDFLGITTLVITDIDSVRLKKDIEEKAEEGDEEIKAGACRTSEEGAVTSNEALKQWIPGLTNIADLLAVDEAKKEIVLSEDCPAKVRIAYQTLQTVAWEGQEEKLVGRTLEETFALENLEWSQDLSRKHLGLRVITKMNRFTLDEVAQKLFIRVSGNSFKKTNFALGLLLEGEGWDVPVYIDEGLKWLASNLVFSGESLQGEPRTDVEVTDADQ